MFQVRRLSRMWLPLLSYLIVSVAGQIPSYMITCPSIVHVGVAESVAIQLHGAAQPVTVNVYFYDNIRSKACSNVTSFTLNAGNEYREIKTITISKKVVKDLQLWRRRRKYVYLVVESRQLFHRRRMVPLKMSSKRGYIFIQTDKPVYTPDQNVLYRVFTLDHYMRPVNDELKLSLFNSRNMELMTFERMSGNMKSHQTKIPDNEQPGIWRIEAEFSEAPMSKATAQFEVKEFVLPRFEVKVLAAEMFYLVTRERFPFTVMATHTYGETFYGEVHVRYGIIHEDDSSTLSWKLGQDRKMSRGKTSWVISTEDLLRIAQLTSWSELLGLNLYLAVTVVECGSDVMEQVELRSIKFVSSPYVVDLSKTARHFIPGVPFHILATVSYPDGTPAVSVPVKPDEGPAVVTDHRGLAIIERNVPANTSILSLKVIAGEGSDGHEASATAVIYHSPSRSYLHIQAPRTMVKVGERLDIEFRAIARGDGGKVDHIYYIVTSKGRILSAERLVKGDPTRLQLPVVQDMIPTFRLLAYYYTRSAGKDEIVANSVWVDVEDKCHGRVEMRDLDEVYRPGSKFDLHFSTNDAANVSFVAVDSAMYILNNKNRLTPRKVFEAMNSYDLGCFYGGGAKSSEVFMDAGLSFLSNVDVSGFRQGYSCKETVKRQRREIRLQEQFSGILSRYPDHRLRKCCLDGISMNLMPLSCEQRAERVNESQCRNVFRRCCEHTLEDRRKQPEIKLLARSYVDLNVVDIDDQLFDEISVHVRSVFPQSWLWETFSAGQAGNHRLTSDIPDSITTWEIQAVGMFEKKGFCVEEPKKMKVFRPFFLAMNLPYSMKKNEQVIVKVTLYNYSPQTVSVMVYTKEAKELCSSLASRENAGTLEVPANAARSIDLTLVPLVVGSIPIHVFAFSHGGAHTDAILKHLRVLYEGNVEQKEWSVVLSSREKRSIEILERSPTNVVPDARNYLYIKPTGTILGNAVVNSLSAAGIDKLITVPTGCAEQTAMHMAPTVFAVEYLDQSEQWLYLAAERKDEALHHIEAGYTKILGYKKDDGSYGAWLTHPSSTWLTAFIVKIFSIGKRHMEVNERIVAESVSYLIKAQKIDGHFEDPHPLLMKAMQGGVGGAEGEVSLTAFVTVAFQHFLKAFLQPNSPSTAKLRQSIGKAVGYLNQELPNIRQPYAVAITAYALAFSQVGTAKVLEAEQKLRDIAIHNADGGGRYWWADGGTPSSASSPPTATALTVETTAYGLLQALARGEVEYGKAVVEWLTQQQNYGGGFQSTQDTVVALEALSKYHAALYERDEDVNIQIKFSTLGKSSNVLLTQKTALTQEELKFPLDEKILVEVSGKGKGKLNLRSVSHIMDLDSGSCDKLHLSITIKNHIRHAESHRRQGSLVGLRKRRVPDSDKYQTVFYEVCMRQDGEHENVLSGMAVVDITLLSGLEPDTKYLDQMANGVEEYINNYELKNGKLLLYLESIPYNVWCLVFPARQIVRLGLMQPAEATLYDFYDPTTRCTVSYSPPEQNTMSMKLCEGSVCTCAAGGCPHEQDILPAILLEDDRIEFACYSPIVDYAFVAQMLNKTSVGYFDKYTMSVRDVYRSNDGDGAGGAKVKTFLHRSSCRLQLREGTDYLLMGKNGNTKHGAGNAQYLLSDTTWIEAIPSQTTCDLWNYREHCQQVNSFIEDFSLSGCGL